MNTPNTRRDFLRTVAGVGAVLGRVTGVAGVRHVGTSVESGVAIELPHSA